MEKAIEVIKQAFQEDCTEYECTIKELFKIFGYDNEDLKEEFISILRENDIDVTDDCELETETGFIPFKDIKKAVLK